MRILHIMAGNKHGGAETACIDMCIAMAESGQTIEIITRPNKNRIPALKKAGIKVHTLPFGGKIDIYTPLMIQKIIKSFEPDIIQTWMSRAAAKTPKWQKGKGIKPYTTFARLGNYYKIKYFKTIEHFVAITPDIRTYLINQNIPEKYTHHINNFAETETVDTPVNREELGANKKSTVLLGLGRLHDDKAFDTLIKAVSRMPEHVHLWIAGEGPDREKLKKLIQERSVADRVKLLGWRKDRAALLQACDICTFTSRDEPFGTVFVQAWAQKTPVITSDADGPRQFVRNGKDGLITQIDNEDEIIKPDIAKESDENLRKSLIKKGFTRYQNEFTKEKSIEAYLNLYKKFLKTQ